MSFQSDLEHLNLQGLRPGELVTYLRVQQWSEERRVNEGKGGLWKNANLEHLLVPLDAELSDYVFNVAQLLGELSKIEQRPVRQVYDDVVATSSDTIRVRMLEVEDDGTLGLERGIAALTSARDMMLAAACASIEPKAYYPSRKFKDAEEFVEGLRLGHTEEGSFILRILSAVPPFLQTSLFDDEDDDATPFERNVATTLMGALYAVEDAATSASIDGNVEPLRQIINMGASANLFDAVRGLALCARDDDFEISVAWSKNRPAPTVTPTRVKFSRSIAPVLNEAATIFKKLYGKREEFELVGVVIRIEREHDEDGSPKEGVVTVLGSVDNRTSRVRMKLRGDDFTRAIQAFEQHEVVRVFGDLHRKRNLYTLKSPRAFAPVPDELILLAE